MAERTVDLEKAEGAVAVNDILRHLDERIEDSEDRHTLKSSCPLRGNGNSLWADNAKRGWECFVCNRQGNVIDAVAKHESFNLKKAAIRIAEWFRLEKVDYENMGRRSDWRGKEVTDGTPTEPDAPQQKLGGDSLSADGLLSAVIPFTAPLLQVKNAEGEAWADYLGVMDASIFCFLHELFSGEVTV